MTWISCRQALTVTVMCVTSLVSLAQRITPLRSSEFEAWHTAMKESYLPYGGCFKASYPTIYWREVSCTPPQAALTGQPLPANPIWLATVPITRGG
jgi:hypothetical protein